MILIEELHNNPSLTAEISLKLINLFTVYAMNWFFMRKLGNSMLPLWKVADAQDYYWTKSCFVIEVIDEAPIRLEDRFPFIFPYEFPNKLNEMVALLTRSSWDEVNVQSIFDTKFTLL